MPYQKKDDYRYNSLGGINNKVSPYLNNQMEFLNLKNFDFQIPGALTKRWGSTQYFGQSLSGKVTGVFEFIQTSGASFFYVTCGGTLGLMFNNGFSSIFHGTSGGLSYFSGYGGSFFDRISIGPSLNADFAILNNQCFSANQQFIFKSNGTSFYFFGLPRIKNGVASYSTSVGSSGVVGGFSGFYYYKFAWINSYGMVGPPTETYVGIPSSSQIYRQAANTQGSTNIIVSLTNTTVPSGTSKLVPPNFDIVAMGIFRSGPHATYDIDAPNFSDAYRFVPGYGVTARYGINNDFEYTYAGQIGVSATSVSITFIDANSAPGITFLNKETIPWEWYYFSPITLSAPGTTAFHLGASTGFGVTMIPNMIETYANRMWLAGMSYAPSTVWFSEIKEPEHLEPDFNFDIRTNDGEPVSALKTYNGNLVIFKYSTFHQLTGDAPDNFVLSQLSAEYGCLSNRAACEYNDILVFLDKKGIIEFNGANIQIISTKIDPIFQRMNVQAAKVNACITYDKQRNELLIDIPVDGSTINNLTVVYDIIGKTWTTYEGYRPAITTIAQGSFSKQECFYGGYSGLVSYFGPTFTSDNGVGFTCVAKSGYATDMGYSISKLFRRLFVDVVPQGTSSIVDVNFYQDYGASVVLGLTFVQTPFQSRLEYGIPGKALSVEFVMGSTYAMTLHGFAIEYRFLRPF